MFCFAVIKRKYNQLTNVNINSSRWRSLPPLSYPQTIAIDNLSRCPMVSLGNRIGFAHAASMGRNPRHKTAAAAPSGSRVRSRLDKRRSTQSRATNPQRSARAGRSLIERTTEPQTYGCRSARRASCRFD